MNLDNPINKPLPGYLFFIALLVLALWLYWPGLAGPFLFDDLANLTALGEYNGVRNWETFKLFVFGNHSGPTGRPVSMLSFLINDTGWPSDPKSFKYTNLLLHLINALLLFWLIIKALGASRKLSSLPFIAVLTAGMWLLHPLNVSTVLYPVQRMTILAALFTLAGLIVYVHGRQQLEEKPRTAYFWMSLSIVLATILATYSKENGALFPLFALIVEYTVLRDMKVKPDIRWQAVFLWLPVILLAAYFLNGIISGSMLGGYSRRPFTLEERLLTEGRILIDYLYYWYIPHVNSPGLLTQDFPLSKSLFEPITTLAAIVSIIVAIVTAIVVRKKHPVISLAILFFFAGHLIESTFIPLELYFEHRNYLPAIFLILPVATGISYLIEKNRIWISAGLLMILIPAVLLSQRSQIWSDEESLAYQWAINHPDSQRALRHAALVAAGRGKYGIALGIMEQARQRIPESVTVHIHWLTLSCRFREITQAEQRQVLENMQNGFYSFRLYKTLRSTVDFIHDGSCRGIKPDFAYSMIDALEKNQVARTNAGARHQLHQIRGILYIKDGQYDLAPSEFRKSLQQVPRIETALVQVAMLATAQQYDLALEHLEHIKSTINIKRTEKTGDLDYAKEIRYLEKQLLADLREKND